MARPRTGFGASVRAAFALLASILFFMAGAWGQSASNGGALYTTHCTSCHSTPQSPYPAQQNGANAPSVISRAITNGMTVAWAAGAQATSDYADLAAYIASGNPPTQPVSTPTTNNVNVPFNTAQGFTAPAVVITPNYLAGGYAVLTSIVVVTAPTKGNVVFSGQNGTYTPNANQSGADSFTWRATNGTESTSLRTTTISIANPPAPTLTPGTISGSTGTAITTFVIAATPFASGCSVFSGTLPAGLALGYNGTNCTIAGTPTATASATTVQIKGTNPGGTGAAATFTFNISLGLPAITSGTPPAGQELVSYTGSYTVTASNGPITAYGATGLPAGLGIVAATGQVTGTPSFTNGAYPITYPVTFTATNATGTGPGTIRNLVINKPIPQLSGAAAASGQTGVAFPGYTLTAVPGAITAVTPTNLPPGLSISLAGVVSGTPTTIGVYNASFTATNSAGTSASFPVTFTITLGPPTVTSASSAGGGELVPFTYQITASNGPVFTGYSLTGALPTGLAFDAVNGTVSGTPAAGTGSLAGTTYPVTVTASNATGTSAPFPLNIVISSQKPVVTSGSTASGPTGATFNYQITANFAPTAFQVGCPTVASGAASLPAGLTFNSATGLISGTPTVPASTPCQITASNGSGTSNPPTALTLNITLGPPVVTSGASAGGAVGFAMTYQVTATNNPTSFGATGLPPGLAVNTATGLISGTPTVNGIFTATVSATNSTASASRTVVFTIAFGLPAITSPATANAATGFPFSYQVTATNGPTSFGASGLPAGVTIDSTTGLISGQFTTFGVYPVTITATNATGTGSAALNISVIQAAPGLTSPTTAAATVGKPFAYAITAANGPVTTAVTGLPPGLSFDAAAGVISGTPTTGGTYPVTISLSNTRSTTTSTLTIIVAFQLPSARDVALDVPYETATVVPLGVTGQVTQLTIVSLPNHGVTVVNGGQVTYTPANGYTGEDSFTYTATNPAGTTAVATVRINVTTLAPTATAAAMTCDINSSATADLSKFVKGSGLTGVAIVSPPLHGKVTMNGMVVTYVPGTDYFGPDAFSYVAFGNAGKSLPAAVSVTVVGRPDPTKDANVTGLIDAQAQAARRFSGAQVANFQRRMEALHRTPPPVEGTSQPTPPVAQQAIAPSAGRAAIAEPVARSSTSAEERAPVAAVGLMPASLVAPFVSAATARAFDLNASTGGGGGHDASGLGLNAWVGGAAQFGRRDPRGEVSGLRFTTDGLSVGVDKRWGERLVLGLGAGYGRDDTSVGADGTHSKVKGQSFALYGSFQPGGNTFLDALAGAGKLDFDSRRHVGALDQFATGSRRGDQAFVSIAGGIELRRDGVLVSPYARVDSTQDRLRAYDESGVGDYALHYNEMRVRSTQVAAGLRVETQHDADFGSVQPRMRLEYRRELQDDAHATLRYADLLDGPLYSVTSTGVSRNALLLGVGADLVSRGGLRVGVDYTAQRASGASNVQMVRILVSQELDGKASPFGWQPRMFKDPVGVEAGYTYDDNVTRGRNASEKRSDSVFSLSAGQPIPVKLGSLSKVRLVLTPQVTGEKFRLYSGLGRFSAGAQAELQYRGSGAFDAITYSLVGRAAYDQYESAPRRGGRYFAGVNARRSLTDRIDVFAEAGRAMREGKSEVFQTREWVGKLNLDYALGGKRGVLYVAGEYRKGDGVSSGPGSLVNVGLADVFVPDDAYPGQDLFAYRFDSRTVLGTVGWNYPLGPRDSIDLSYRRAQSTPSAHTQWDSGTLRYIDNQYSIVYLMRF